MDSERRHRELALFLVGVASVIVVLAGILVTIGMDGRSRGHSVRDQPWFDVGVAVVALGVLVLVSSLVLYIRDRARIVYKPTRLETWLQERIDAADAIERQRSMRGPGWFLGAMSEWDTENIKLMASAPDPIAPDLVSAYQCDPRTGWRDERPPDGREELDAYYARRRDWMDMTLRESRTHDRVLPDGDARATTSLIQDLQYYLNKGREIESRLGSVVFEGSDKVPVYVGSSEVPVALWAHALCSRLHGRPDLAKRFEYAPPEDSGSRQKLRYARSFLIERLASLEKIIRELGD